MRKSEDVIKEKVLENIQINILKIDKISADNHAIQFAKLLHEKIPGLEIRLFGKKVMVFLNSAADDLI